MASPHLLDGVRVLDFANVGPAARASRILSDYGADIIKVGPPPGRVRHESPFYAYSGDRDMRHLGVDLKAPAGKDAILRLAKSSQVVIESFRPGVMDRITAANAGSPELAMYLGTGAVALATINVVGGYMVTDRMLAMFKKKD